MATGVYVFGHGGGVPMGNAGNTNFAIFPDVPDDFLGTHRQYRDLADLPFWLVDCGPETMLQICGCLPGYASILHNLQGIILTHLHADHAGGLASLAWRLKFIEQMQPWLIVPEDLWPMLEMQLVELRYHNPVSTKENGGPFGLDAYFKCKQLESVFGTAGITIKPFPVDHNIIVDEQHPFPAFGLNIQCGDAVLVFSGDTADVLPLDRLNDAHIIFHDCQFYTDGKDGKHVHAPYHALAELPEEVRQKTYLAHTIQEPPPEAFAAGFQWASRSRFILVLH